MSSGFHSPFSHGFLRVASVVPRQFPAQPTRNAQEIVGHAKAAAEDHARVVVFPELCLSGYAIDDLLQQEALLRSCDKALEDVLTGSLTIEALLFVGLPLRVGDRLFNVAAAIAKGRLIALYPKQYIPNYREFYEKRHFATGAAPSLPSSVTVAGQTAPFGTRTLIELPACAGARVHAEICEDLWAPIPPSTNAALAGATVLCNLSASNVTIGKSDYRRLLASGQSARTLAAYVYTGAGEGESSNDLAWDGHAMIYENGRRLAESERFATSAQLISSDIDVEMLRAERMRMTSFADNASRTGEEPWRIIRLDEVSSPSPEHARTELRRPMQRFPYVPADRNRRDERCYEAYNIQVQALAQRIRATGIERLVIGVSGGLDSTHALIVACRAMDRLKLPRTNIIARTMPGFATSGRTLRNALALMKALGVDSDEIDIRASCMQMFRDLDHPYAEGVEQYDVTFENVQAGERTSHLFRLANLKGAMVVGTGDLSELALGWATYGVGDHMSHYGVNASVPKTLIRYLIRWVADSGEAGEDAADILRDIVATEISPELVPQSRKAPDQELSASEASERSTDPSQSSEASIGPYELQDFHLYYISRYGFSPGKVAYLAFQAWSSLDRGTWPEDIPAPDRHAYDLSTIKKWLGIFLKRFFGFSQFKRTCIPNGPKVGSGGSLSPRGDWRAPSDISAEIWLENLNDSVPDSSEAARPTGH